MSRPIDAYQAIDIIDEWLDSVGTVMVGHGLSSYGELIGCIEDTPTLTPQNEWVRVEERLPESIVNKVLVYCENGYIGYGHYEKYQGEETWYNLESGEPFASWNLENCSPYKVTHWMPLPKSPKEDG